MRLRRVYLLASVAIAALFYLLVQLRLSIARDGSTASNIAMDIGGTVGEMVYQTTSCC